MEDYNIDIVMLAQYARRLHTVSGKFNLYINMCCENSTPNIERLNSEIQIIKELVANIEWSLTTLETK